MKHHRIKSTRIEKNAKEIRRLYREHRRLWAEKWNAPLIELKEPYVRGFERFFILTPSAQRRADAEKLNTILNYFQHYEYCRKGWFRGSMKARKRLAKGEVGPHYLQRPQLIRLIKKSFPNKLYPYVKSHFIDLQNGFPPIRQLRRHQLEERVRFRLPHLLESHIQPHLVTHLRTHDPALESRLDYLQTRLWGEAEAAAVSKALHCRRWRNECSSRSEKSARDDFREQLKEANIDPSIQSAISPRFFCARIIRAILLQVPNLPKVHLRPPTQSCRQF